MMRRIRRAESSACSRTRGCEVGNASSTTTASSRPRADCSKTTDYSLAFGDANELAIDAEKEGNDARFCNDFRNTGRSQNAKFESYVDEAGHAKLAIFVLPHATIAKGEEILISYGKSFWKHRVGEDLESFRSDV